MGKECHVCDEILEFEIELGVWKTEWNCDKALPNCGILDQDNW